MHCTSCGVYGWLDRPDSLGSGKGAKCMFCGYSKMRVVATLDTGTRVKHCYNCGATTFK